MATTQLAPVLGIRSLANTYRYAGGTISILVPGEQTGGALAMWESRQKPGGEPPLHIHHSNDETFYVLEGQVRFFAGGKVHDAVAGEAVCVPRGTPHTFRIKSGTARMVTVCTPSGFEEWFRQMGEPAQSFELPAQVVPPAESDYAKMAALSRQLDTELIPGDVDR